MIKYKIGKSNIILNTLFRLKGISISDDIVEVLEVLYILVTIKVESIKVFSNYLLSLVFYIILIKILNLFKKCFIKKYKKD